MYLSLMWKLFVGIGLSYLLVFHARLLPAQSLDMAGDSAAQLERDEAVHLCQQQYPDAALPSHPFTTDGCSAWPDGAWHQCCVEHDYVYWCGGSDQQREQADRVLQQCVAAAGYSAVGTIMYFGVRLGGAGFWPFPWRWGYGWDWLEGRR
jgi:hypothetical protein